MGKEIGEKFTLELIENSLVRKLQLRTRVPFSQLGQGIVIEWEQ